MTHRSRLIPGQWEGWDARQHLDEADRCWWAAVESYKPGVMVASVQADLVQADIHLLRAKYLLEREQLLLRTTVGGRVTDPQIQAALGVHGIAYEYQGQLLDPVDVLVHTSGPTLETKVRAALVAADVEGSFDTIAWLTTVMEKYVDMRAELAEVTR